MANPKLCSIPDCGKPHLARGYCKSHYVRLCKYNDPLGGHFFKGAVSFSPCAVEGCDRNAFSGAGGKRGWCGTHYQMWRKHGDPLGGGTANGEPLKFLTDVVLTYDGDDCLTWPYARNTQGYGNITLGGRTRKVSRVVCETVYGPPPTKTHHAAHSCGRGHLGCVTKGHLSWKTPAGNMADKAMHGTGRGELLTQSKLTEENVRYIRSRRGIETQASLAARFNVSQSRISSVQNRIDWAWLD